MVNQGKVRCDTTSRLMSQPSLLLISVWLEHSPGGAVASFQSMLETTKAAEILAMSLKLSVFFALLLLLLNVELQGGG